jgi:cytochrome c oxidase assembly protein subunit 15
VLLFIQFIWSLKFRKTKSRITWLSFALLIITGFQGWLGSKVVEGNLEVAKVTTHMLVAVVIAAMSYRIIYEARPTREKVMNKNLRKWTLITLALLLVQVILGTQVREEIDHISLALNFSSRELWIEKLGVIFYIHRSFSILAAAACIYLFIKYRKYNFISGGLTLAAFCVLAVILLGVLMNYFSVPALAQPLHLLLSMVLIISIYSVYCKTIQGRSTVSS